MRNERNEKKSPAGLHDSQGLFCVFSQFFLIFLKKGSTYFFTIEMALEASLTTT